MYIYIIQHQTSVAYTPEQNGRAEREIRTIVETARTMILENNFNKRLWAEALNTGVFVSRIIADIFSKPLGKLLLQKLRNGIFG